MSDIEIRRASAADVDALAALRRAWVEEQAGRPVVDEGFEPSFAAWFDSERDQRVTWLATAAEEPVGMLNMLVFTRMPRPGLTTSRWGYLANFFVRADHRAAGLGSDLLATCVDHADSNDFVRIVLSPSERSRSIYLRAGFGTADALLVRPGRS